MRTKRTLALPPLATQVIGSLPRPKVVRDALARRAELPPGGFEDLLDELVIFAIRLQEQAGLDVVSDGEWRRLHYVGEFLQRIGGFERVRPFEHQGEKKLHDVVVRRMTPRESVFADEASFLVRHTNRCTKFALPSPFLIAIRYWHEDYSRNAYSTFEGFLEAVTEILAGEARAVAGAGVDVIQIDDPALTYFCDPRLMTEGVTHDDRLRRGWDIETQFPRALEAINRIVEGLPAEVHLHCCHSVYKRKSDVTGDYKPILPLLSEAKVDRLNIEFAYQGTGKLSDLEVLPRHLSVGMGVVDVRREGLQSVEEIEALAGAGANIVGPERMWLNPDCGFAPDAAEPPTIDEAYEKLSRMVQAAMRLRAIFSRERADARLAP
jgi:5-methyltetrahydropteroyltriglutamate--homocysteine methyltransferase